MRCSTPSTVKSSPIPRTVHPESSSWTPQAAASTSICLKPIVWRFSIGRPEMKWRAGAWPTRARIFPLRSTRRAGSLVEYRSPATLAAFGTRTGKLISEATSYDNADKFFYGKKRERVHELWRRIPVCLESLAGLTEIARMCTQAGACTALFSIRALPALCSSAGTRSRPGSRSACFGYLPACFGYLRRRKSEVTCADRKSKSIAPRTSRWPTRLNQSLDNLH